MRGAGAPCHVALHGKAVLSFHALILTCGRGFFETFHALILTCGRGFFEMRVEAPCHVALGILQNKDFLL